MHHQGRVQQQGGLVVVGYNASDEVGIGLVEGGQQGVQLGPEGRGDGLESLRPSILALLLLLYDFFGLTWVHNWCLPKQHKLEETWVISEEVDNQCVVTFLQLVHNLAHFMILIWVIFGTTSKILIVSHLTVSLH